MVACARNINIEHQHCIIINRVVHDLCGPMGTTRNRRTQMPLARVACRIVGFRAALALRTHTTVRNTNSP